MLCRKLLRLNQNKDWVLEHFLFTRSFGTPHYSVCNLLIINTYARSHSILLFGLHLTLQREPDESNNQLIQLQSGKKKKKSKLDKHIVFSWKTTKKAALAGELRELFRTSIKTGCRPPPRTSTMEQRPCLKRRSRDCLGVFLPVSALKIWCWWHGAQGCCGFPRDSGAGECRAKPRLW